MEVAYGIAASAREILQDHIQGLKTIFFGFITKEFSFVILSSKRMSHNFKRRMMMPNYPSKNGGAENVL